MVRMFLDSRTRLDAVCVPAPPGLYFPSRGCSEARSSKDRRLRLHTARSVHFGKLERLQESVEENEDLFEDADGTMWQESKHEEHEMSVKAAKATYRWPDTNQLSEKDASEGTQKELAGIDIDANSSLTESAQDRYSATSNLITIPSNVRSSQEEKTFKETSEDMAKARVEKADQSTIDGHDMSQLSKKENSEDTRKELEDIDIDANIIPNESARGKYVVESNRKTEQDRAADETNTANIEAKHGLDNYSSNERTEDGGNEKIGKAVQAKNDGLDKNQLSEKDSFEGTLGELEDIVNPTMLDNRHVVGMIYDELVSMAQEGAETP
ncbi:unnamed protein product [Prorocentrum cordatum]|uniref:Uncharacterized protein n=1 Tax=Prorocentrum cordatum TaxID=2364126 RepID=A0ABN9YCZ1_9DINO|nr:unnamed protein product [Polarella glacialis]